VNRTFDACSASREKTFERPLSSIGQGLQPDFDRFATLVQSARNGFARLSCGERSFEFVSANKDFHGIPKVKGAFC
jgi:hypothetical protein